MSCRESGTQGAYFPPLLKAMESVDEMARSVTNAQLHVAMYPWFAMGHITPFLHLANKLAHRSHRVSFFLPANTISKVANFNLHPHLIHFIPVIVPHVDGLPHGAETTADVPFPLHRLIMTAMDRTQSHLELSLRNLKPNFVFFDFTHWMPALAHRLGIKSVHYCIISSVTIGFILSPARNLTSKLPEMSEDELMTPPPGFPNSPIKLHRHEIRQGLATLRKEFGSGVSFFDRSMIALRDADALSFRTCREIESPFCDYIESQFKKPVLLSGPVLPEPPTDVLEHRWAEWLGRFEAGSVVYCAFGSEGILSKGQFQELVLGLEFTGLPFLAALKPPMEAETIEAALPEGFEERVRGRGVVHGGWVQQQLILGHPSIGCFVTHCGSGSLAEALVKTCQLVLLPNVGDQIINARLMGDHLKVGVEVERGEEDGLFTRESVCNAVKLVVEENSEVGREVRANHRKWRELLIREGLESCYIEGFIEKLQAMASLQRRESLNSQVT